MDTKFLMVSSSIFMGFLGILFVFLPQEILSFIGLNSNGMGPLFIQVLGALYFAFAMINWMVRANLIGGIYNRPVAVGNFIHFLMGALVLVKGILGVQFSIVFLIACIIYSTFAILFGIVLFNHPIKAESV
ncbi:MAG: hypothetical protein ACYDEE_17175 [Ignavibacteriaceae bacterium]